MEEAIENQPHCESVTVEILTDRLDTIHGYCELTGEYMEVEIVVDYEGHRVRTRMDVQDGYPLMRVVDVEG